LEQEPPECSEAEFVEGRDDAPAGDGETAVLLVNVLSSMFSACDDTSTAEASEVRLEQYIHFMFHNMCVKNESFSLTDAIDCISNLSSAFGLLTR
jgi:hypothetical protein